MEKQDITRTPDQMTRSGREMLPLTLGAYLVSCNGAEAAFAVSILGSAVLVGKIARVRPTGLCIAGRCETGSIGLDKAIRDTIVMPLARYLIVCGIEESIRSVGRALCAIKTNGVDGAMRIVGLPGTSLILKGVSRDEIETFREHIHVMDMTWTDDVETIVAKINGLSCSCTPGACDGCVVREKPAAARSLPSAFQGPGISGLDSAGFFIIRPDAEKDLLTVEHYYYDCRLIRRIVGRDKRAIFRAIIDNRWATQSSHVAYIWRELARAEQALKSRLKYVQDVEPL